MKRIRSGFSFGCSALLLTVPFLLTGCTSLTNGGSGWSLANLLSGPAGDQQNSADEDIFGEADPNRLMWSDLGPGRIGTTIQRRFSTGQDRGKAEKLFAEGQQIYNEALARWDNDRRGDETSAMFREASQKFELAADFLPDSAVEHDALFLQGESSFFANDYVQANRAYEILLNRYSGTRQLDLVQSRRFEIAQYWLALDRQGAGITLNESGRPNSGLEKHARRILHRIRLDDPTGKLADDATMALANAFAEAGLHADAADAYEDLRRTYPASPHQFHAHLFELKSRLSAYRGPSYDGTDLEKAEKLMKTIVRQFPAEVDQEREFLTAEAGRIQDLLAEREWTVGNYYEVRGENRAAKFHYAKITESYGESQLARDAEERIAALGGMPAVPSQKLPWLANLFPVKERNKPLFTPGDNETILR